MKELRWTVYCHIHTDSGRRFIGSTKSSWRSRWNRRIYASKRANGGWSRIANAIRKYGKDAFDHEVLETCHSLEEAGDAEKKWITHFDSTDPEKGFNLSEVDRAPREKRPKSKLSEEELRKKEWTIYCHIHCESGRCYIGVTSWTWRKRWNRHVYSANRGKGSGRSHFHNAIRKYGKDAFDHEVLQTCHTLEEANLAEQHWIDLYDTRNPLRGFNLKPGGSHTPHPNKNPWDRPEYRKKAAAASRKKWENPEFRAAVTAGVTEAWQDPDYRSRLSDISKEINSRPEVKAAQSKAASSRPGMSSRFRGVCWNKALRKWRVSFRHNGKMINIGHFSDEEIAARAHDVEIIKLSGSRAQLNFPS